MSVGGVIVPSVGAVLSGKYRILDTLGAGGMGTVFSAENILTHKRVALKWLHPQAPSKADADAGSRLLREAQAASRLRHPSVVDVYDLVREGDTLYMVMELLEGETLRAYLKRNPRPKVSEFISTLLPALEGVAAAHDHGVIHRDLKPDNIFLVRSPNVAKVQAKVLDFGVAKLTEAPGLALTRTGTTLGTPLYMSLEQLRGDKQVDPRTDVYALGVILYEALSGRHPYDATTLSELAIKVATVPPIPLKELSPELPTALTRLVDWAIAKQPDSRLPSVRAMIRELEPFAQEHSLRNELTNLDATVPRLPAGELRDPARPAAESEAHPLPLMAATRARTRPPDTLTARELPATSGGQARRGRWSLALAAVAMCALTVVWWSYRRPQLAIEAQSIGATVAMPAVQAAASRASDLGPPLHQVASLPDPVGSSYMTIAQSEGSAPPAEPSPVPHPSERGLASKPRPTAGAVLAKPRRASEPRARETLGPSRRATDRLGF